MDMHVTSSQLDSLNSDIILQVALFLDLDDLESLALSCKNLYAVLRLSGIQGHWTRHLPSAFLPIEQPFPDGLDSKETRDAIRRVHEIRSSYIGWTSIKPKRNIEVVESYWNLHIPHTRWMFTFCKKDAHTSLRCIDLMTGGEIGERDLGPVHPKQKLLAGQISGRKIILSYACESAEDDSVWDVNLVMVDFTSSASGGVRADFAIIKTLRIPPNLAQPFPQFDALQIEGNYIILSGNWVCRHFLLIDWSSEKMMVHSCSEAWKTFDWKLINGSFIVAYDDHQIWSTNVAQMLASSTPSSGIAEPVSKNLLNIPVKGCIEFVERDDNSFCALVVHSYPGRLFYEFSATRITTGNDGLVSLAKDPFHKLELRPRCPELYEDSLPLYVGTSVVFLDDIGLTIYVLNDSGSIQQKVVMLCNPILAIIEVDEEIGMIAVRESDGNRAYTRVYWIA